MSQPTPQPQPSPGRREGPRPSHSQPPQLDVSRIRFAKPLDPELFNSVAKQAAQRVANAPDRYCNKPTQLRRFYDELLLWEGRVAHFATQAQQQSKFQEYLPFIRMINAKVAYAAGRKPRLVDDTFVNLMHHTLGEVKDPESLTVCKLFWEAFMGFYKQLSQDRD